MKKLYTTLVTLMVITHFSYGQWTYPSGTIATTNKVGIGGSASSNSQLQVTGDASITGSSPVGGTFLTLDDQATTGRTGVRLRFQSNGVAHWNLGISANVDAFSINGWNGTTPGVEFLK